MVRKTMAAAVAVLALAACGGGGRQAPGPAAETPLVVRNAQGQQIGTVRVDPTSVGTRLELRVSGLTPGLHGTHLHQTGRCDAPDFTSAGGHWNPMGRQHGMWSPQGPHMGDLANLLVGPDGTGILTWIVPAPFIPGPSSMLDADGTALVIHAGADDNRTDPAGDSGPRVACAVIAQPGA